MDVLGRYRRRAEEVDDMIAEAYVGGVSQRKMADVTEALMGESVGRSTVSRVAKRLDVAVQELRNQPLTTTLRRVPPGPSLNWAGRQRSRHLFRHS